MTTLVIAEKPAMARDIAQVIGATARQNGFFSGNGYLVTYAVGHLVELCDPAEYNAQWQYWTPQVLPMIPAEFRYQATGRTRRQFDIVKKLLTSGEADRVINACDAGREGELIFWLIYELAGAQAPVSRLWISSLTTEAIRQGFENLQPGEKYTGLREAAKLRQQADWLIGLNATRAQTCIARQGGGREMYSLGRVQTPTLCLIVWRDGEIDNFVSVPYFELKAQFQTPDGENFSARLFDIQSKQIKRFEKIEKLNQLVVSLKTENASPVISVLSEKQVKLNSPALFDLTLLQRTANTRFGLTAAKTLEIAQSLYEKKILTYPRTASCFLTEDVANQTARIISGFKNTAYGELAREITENSYSLNPKKINNEKVQDHHAIIPTGHGFDAASLDANESKIYDLVARRFLAAFYPEAEDRRIDVLIKVGGSYFAAKGKTEVNAGWRVIEHEDKPEADDAEDSNLPVLLKEMDLAAINFEPLSKQTRAPWRFTESSLLQAMETAGRFVKNDAEREALKDGGLGTPSTRASIIEKLIDRGYIERVKKTLSSTKTAREVIARLERCSSLLASPALTGKWEAALSKVEKGTFSAAEFRQSVVDLTRTTVTQILAQNEADASDFAGLEGIAKCPKCVLDNRAGLLRSSVKEGRKFSFCTLRRDVCGYITQTPTKKKHLEKCLPPGVRFVPER